MVAYSFQPSFAAEILAGRKRQTIRLPRGERCRHARRTDALQLYTGMRTRQCRKLGDAICTGVHEVVLDFTAGRVTLDDAIEISHPGDLDAFAAIDGFGGWNNRPWVMMRTWWRNTHRDQPLFRGVLIAWGDSFRPLEAADAAA